MKALLVFRNVLGHMSREEASLTALQLVEKLLPLFDDESSQLRELSICLFRDVIQMVVGKDKKQMEENVRRSLLPLFFRMSDQSESVAKLVQDRSRVEEYLSQSLPYLKDAQVPLREAAVRFIGLAAQHWRDQSEEKLAEICTALQLLEKDAELSVSSLAIQTMLIVRSPRKKATSGWTLWALCCWPCKARQK
ncbi:maestro heat-like repeat-containing protein family member 7 isoform 2-T3 [Theristicus caerulescens]